MVSTILGLISSPIWSWDRLVAYRTKGQEVWSQFQAGAESCLFSKVSKPGQGHVELII